MSLEGFYYNKQQPKLNWAYSHRALYKSMLEYGLARQRLCKLFESTLEQRIVDEVC